MTVMAPTPRLPNAARLAPVVFTATIFLSASLLFFVQPLFTKIVMPHIGGAPAVWTTAMLFFQTMLIGGYAYAHFSTKYLPVWAQLGLHLTLWAAALSFLPLSIAAGWQYDAESSTVAQTLALFAAGVGLPFLVLSANAPLIQSWYSKSGGPSADDPYFLYGASNLGSLLALLGFPLVAEPLFGARNIGFGWAAGFVLLGGFLLSSGLFAAGRARARALTPQLAEAASAKPTPKQIAWWLLLAFIPSSLMLGVTAKVSTDIGSFPLVWAIPLSLYLLSFVMTFTQRSWISDRVLNILLLVALPVMTGLVMGSGFLDLKWSSAGLLVAGFFIVALMAHRRLYQARPDGAHLTQFYVIMSIGGALGGLFNSIIAPTIFDELHEVRLLVILSTLLLVTHLARPNPRHLTYGLGLGFAVLTVQYFMVQADRDQMYLYVATSMAILLAGFWLCRNLAYVASFATALALGVIALVPLQNAIHKDRSFFGTHNISDTKTMRHYSNGTTIHGAQPLEDGELTLVPQFYYHRNAPMAQVLQSQIGAEAEDIGIVGLGIGALACYARPGQNWQYYEIDKTVYDIATNENYFTFLSGCTPDAPTHLGDARIVLAGQTDTTYDVLVIDAYSSDAVPVHLTTTEAMELYLDRLAPGGVLLYHISNRYYDLSKPLGRSAAALGVSAHLQSYRPTKDDADPGDVPSVVVAISRDEAFLGKLDNAAAWTRLQSDGGRLWTDDFANLMGILH